LGFLKDRFPDHLILFRSLNEDYNAQEIKALASLNCKKIGSRRVYLLKRENIKSSHREILKKDARLMRSNNYSFEKAGTEDVTEIKQFYDYLYIAKYSMYNPRFTELFYKNVVENSLFDVQMLRRGDGKAKGVYGLFARGDGITAPIFGYAEKDGKASGFYRVLSLWGVDLIESGSDLKINYSAGVADFKRCRGAVGTTEYSLFLDEHLPLYRKIFWSLFSMFINKVLLPIVIWNKY
jgi:hypothetical protein